MPFELISEEEMATKRKERIKITKRTEDHNHGIELKVGVGIEKEGEKEEKIAEKKEEKIAEKIGEEIKVEKKEIEKPKNVIVKKLYFPGDVYSNNQAEFKKILSNHGLAWFRPMYKMYASKSGVKLASGMYISGDKNKKVLCIYEGSKMPMTAIIKIIGTGGNFLIELNSFCSRVGCIIEDKDEQYSDKVASTLKERGELYVEGMEDTIAEKIKKGDITIEDKINKIIDESLQKYVDAYKDSLERKGVSLETFKFFKRKDIEKDIRWAIENGVLNIEK